MQDHPPHKIVVKTFTHGDLPVHFIGPDLATGVLPALFYFALSAQESLSIDPYNQPIVYLSSLPIRIFSFDLPGHGMDLPSREALRTWADAFERGDNILETFVQRVAALIFDLQEKEIIAKEKCAAAGLSRGAFIATHVAARCSAIRSLVGFAPLTKLTFASEFSTHHQLHMLQEIDIENCIPRLLDRTLRFYIGNCDKLVGTRNCFDFIEKLTSAMDAVPIRSPQVELIISPSIGAQGHGTSKQIFHQGAEWIAEQLGVSHAR